MGSITHTVGGNSNLVSFKSAARVPIESLKVHFSPIQEGEGDPSPENVRPISGWDGIEQFYSGKNIGHIVGYSAVTQSSPTSTRNYTNSYGTSLNTIDYTSPDTSLVIAQEKWPETNNIQHYKNGYIAIEIDNLVFGEYYDISFKVSNIINNPLNATLQNLGLGNPFGSRRSPNEIKDNVVIYKNVLFAQKSLSPNEMDFDLRICGMSFTLSEFMVTPAGMNDGVFEPYYGKVLPVNFPVLGKNKFEFTAYSVNDWSTAGYPLSPQIDVETNTITLTGYGSGDTQLYNLKNVYYPGTYTFSFDMSYVSERTPDKRMVIRCYNENDQLMTKDQVSITNFTYNKYYKGWFSTPRTFTVPNNVAYFKLSVGCGNDKKGDTIIISNVQLELGDTATTYEPYDPNNIVYGGYVDLVKGELVAEYGQYIFTGDSKDLITFTRIDSNSNRQQFNTKILDYKIERLSGSLTYANIMNNYHYYSSSSSKLEYYIGTPTNEVAFIVPVDLCEPTAESFNQWLSNNNLQLVYKLAEPIHYPLTPHQLTTFLNQNNFWSNTNGPTEVSYAIHDSEQIRVARKRILAAAPKIEEASGNIATFNTDMSAPLKECKIYFEPRQEGEGNPSPDNIRPITGFENININQYGKNLFDKNKVESGYISAVTTSTRTLGEIISSSSWSTSDYILVKPSTIYTLSIPNQGNASVAGLVTYTANQVGKEINGISLEKMRIYQSSSYTFSTPSNCKYIRFAMSSKNIDLVQFEENSIESSYEPYQNQTIPITFPSEAGTVYGGYVDLVTGELVAEYEMLSDTWGNWGTVTDQGDGTELRYKRFTNPVYGDSKGNNISYCNVAKYHYTNNNGKVHFYMPSTSYNCRIYLPSGTDTNLQIQAVGKLITPIIYQLTSTQLKTLRGTNNIWSSANGDIEVKYWSH